MDKDEALELIEKKVGQWRTCPYSKIERLLDAPERGEISGPSGVCYQFEVEAFWDAAAGGNIRVAGTIHDGGWSAFHPISTDFIMAPDGSFVGE